MGSCCSCGDEIVHPNESSQVRCSSPPCHVQVVGWREARFKSGLVESLMLLALPNPQRVEESGFILMPGEMLSEMVVDVSTTIGSSSKWLRNPRNPVSIIPSGVK